MIYLSVFFTQQLFSKILKMCILLCVCYSVMEIEYRLSSLRKFETAIFFIEYESERMMRKKAFP